MAQWNKETLNRLLREFCSRHDYKLLEQKQGLAAAGSFRGYPFFITLWSGKVYQLTLTTGLDIKADKKEYRARYKAFQKALKGTTLGLNASQTAPSGVFPLFLTPKSLGETPLETGLERACEALRQAQVPPQTLCPFCGQGSCDALAYHQRGYRALHRRCLKSFATVQGEEIERNRQGSRLLGAAGALLGALIGSLPVILLAVFLDTLYAICFALIPLGASFVYKRTKAPLDKGAVLTTVLTSILSVFWMLPTITAIVMAQSYRVELGRAFRLVGSYISTPEGFGEMMGLSPIFFFFLALGLFFTWRSISATNYQAEQNMDFILASLQDKAPEENTAP